MKKVFLISLILISSLAQAELSIYETNMWQTKDLDGKAMPYYAASIMPELRTWLMQDWKVFMWGSSDCPEENTLSWFARHTSSVTYVDWDQNWISELDRFMQSLQINNVKFISGAREEKRVMHKQFGEIVVNTFSDYGEKSAYVNAIAQAGIKYDLILVNGHHRNTCAIKALEWIKPGGRIIMNNVNQATIGIDSQRACDALANYPHFSFLHPGHLDWRTDYWIIQ